MMIVCVPCSVVGFIGLGGLAHVCKNVAWQEGLLIGPDFFKGIKKNWKHSLVIGLIWGLSLFLLVVGTFFLLRAQQSSSQPWVLSIGVGLCITQFIILSIVCVYALNYTCFYVNTLREVLKNSFVSTLSLFFFLHNINY